MSTKFNSERGNKILLNSFNHVLSFYSRRRNIILRLSYIIVLVMIFNGGGSSRRKKNPQKKNQVKRLPLKRADTIPYDKSKSSFRNYVSRFVDRVKNSPTSVILTQFNYKEKTGKTILMYFGAQIILLVCKAVINLKVASLDGLLVSSLISKKFRRFFKYLTFWMLLGFPASFTDAMINKIQHLISKTVRFNVTENILDDYLPDSGNSTIYQLINDSSSSDKQNVVEDPSQRITAVVEQFATSLSILPSQLLNPVLDILLAANQLSKTGENAAEGALLLGLVANLSSLALKIFTPNFSAMTNLRNTLENKFHVYHSRIVDNNEEIALTKGHRREIEILDTNYFELERFKRLEFRRMAVYDFAVSFIFKYSLGAFGLMLCSLPIFTTAYANNFQLSALTMSKISSDFITNRRLLLSASDSLGKVIQSKKNIQNLNSFSWQLWDFETVLKDINKNAEKEEQKFITGDNIEKSVNFDPLVKGKNISYGDEITFNHIPLITPNGNRLVNDLHFSIKSGDNLLIIGPNGCGKSSLFRILGGLWEVRDPGELIIPSHKKDLFYLPQRSYLTYGSLKEQIIYPDSLDDYNSKVTNAKKNQGEIIKDDQYLVKLLKIVKLDHLLELGNDEDEEDNDLDSSDSMISSIATDSTLCMPSPLDIIQKWPDVLSVGEQQRLALVRLYYHQPKFAVLDECTSSISSDLESECYRLAIEDFGITVISVCHRSSLWKFHSHILKFKRINEDNVSSAQDGSAAAVTLFTKFDPIRRLDRHNELIAIENNLKKSENLSKRLESLKKTKYGSNGGTGRSSKLMFIGDDDDEEEEEEEDDDNDDDNEYYD